jgi:uncharacterized membrane protein YfcA
MISPSLFILKVFFISVIGGTLGSLLGLGGGIIITPCLTLILGVNIRYAIGASIVSVIATSSGAAATFVKNRLTNIRVAMLLEVGTTFGALLGVSLAPFISNRWLYLGFSIILLYSAFYMGKPSHARRANLTRGDWWANSLRLNSSYPDGKSGKMIPYAVTRVPLGFVMMVGAGLISGLIGVGSGILKIPAMDGVMRLPMKVSSATSSFMIGVTAAASAGTFFMRGDIIPLLAAPVALGVVVGSRIGIGLMMRLPSQKVRQLFVVILILIAIQMGFKAFNWIPG